MALKNRGWMGFYPSNQLNQGVCKVVLKSLIAYLSLGVLALSAQAMAEDAAERQMPEFHSEAHEVVQRVTWDLFDVIRQQSQLLASDPETYFHAVQQVLDPVVDFDFIARGVMGRYGKSASAEQRQRFTEVFRRGLVVTYAKGLAGYGDNEIVVLPPEGDVGGQRKVSVRQQVTDDQGNTHVLAYTMARTKTGDWKLINVVMNGINLGKTFRNQFYQAASASGGDIDAVISNWLENGA